MIIKVQVFDKFYHRERRERDREEREGSERERGERGTGKRERETGWLGKRPSPGALKAYSGFLNDGVLLLNVSSHNFR